MGLRISLSLVIPQLKFDSTTNRRISSPEAIQANSGRENKQTVRRIRKNWTQEENRIVMESYYRNKPNIDGYRQRMYAIWKDKGMFNITKQRLIYGPTKVR